MFKKSLFLFTALFFSLQAQASTMVPLAGQELGIVYVMANGRLMDLSARQFVLAELGLVSGQTVTLDQANEIMNRDEEIEKK